MQISEVDLHHVLNHFSSSKSLVFRSYVILLLTASYSRTLEMEWRLLPY